jgi:hypothetical protein
VTTFVPTTPAKTLDTTITANRATEKNMSRCYSELDSQHSKFAKFIV